MVSRSAGSSAVDVVAGAFVTGQPGDHDGVQGPVGLAVPAAVEPVAVATAGLDGFGGGAAELGERGLVAQPVGVVPGGDEQGRGRMVADAAAGDQSGGGLVDEPVTFGLQLLDLAGQGLDAPAELAHRQPGGRGRVGGRAVGEPRDPAGELGG